LFIPDDPVEGPVLPNPAGAAMFALKLPGRERLPGVKDLLEPVPTERLHEDVNVVVHDNEGKEMIPIAIEMVQRRHNPVALPWRRSRRIPTTSKKTWPESLKKPAPLADGVYRHDGKEAKRMGRKATRRGQGRVSDTHGDSPVSPHTVKVTLHLTVGTAQRLGVESAMRRISQSAIAEEVLAAYLSRWQLPAVPDSNRFEAG
jgi:hypothetical protein